MDLRPVNLNAALLNCEIIFNIAQNFSYFCFTAAFFCKYFAYCCLITPTIKNTHVHLSLCREIILEKQKFSIVISLRILKSFHLSILLIFCLRSVFCNLSRSRFDLSYLSYSDTTTKARRWSSVSMKLGTMCLLRCSLSIPVLRNGRSRLKFDSFCTLLGFICF